jgi:serine/threonine-protein kinase
MRHRRRVRSGASFVLAACVAVGMAGTTAHAQSPEARAAAATLFEDGRRLMAEGKHAEACPKLEESQRIDPGMGTLFNLAVCYEAIGRTASAWVAFRDVAGQALGAGQAERESAARARAAALEPKLMRLKISVPAGANVEVKRDGVVLGPTLWGTPLPLEAGPHKVTASAPGKEPWETTVKLEQPGGTVNVDVPALADARVAPQGPPPGPRVPTPDAPPDVKPSRPWQLPLGITAAVLGAGGLGAGIGLGITAKSAFDASNQTNCNKATNVCNTAGLSQRSDAVSKGNIGTGVGAAGAALAVAGVVLWITAPSRATPPRSGGAFAPELGIGPSGVALRASF